jgi:hypothetical protein
VAALPWSITRLPPADEWPEILVVMGVALAVEVGVRVLPLPRLATMVGAPLDAATAGALDGPPQLLWSDHRRRRVVRRVMRHWPWGDTCLRHALVTGHRLRHLKPALRVGVAKVDGAMTAHAWLEIAGATLDPAGSATFVPVHWGGQPPTVG